MRWIFRSLLLILALPAFGQPAPPTTPGRPRPSDQIRAAKPMPKEPSDYAVLLSARIRKSSPQIELVWVADPNATQYTIYRRVGAAGDFGNPLAILPGTATSWLDTNVAVGHPYTYRVEKKFRQLWNQQMTDFAGFGMLYAGIEKPLDDQPGKVVLVVDQTQAQPLAAEIARLQDDLVADGWGVLRHDVAPTDAVFAPGANARSTVTALCHAFFHRRTPHDYLHLDVFVAPARGYDRRLCGRSAASPLAMARG